MTTSYSNVPQNVPSQVNTGYANVNINNYDEAEDITIANETGYSNAEFIELSEANAEESRKFDKEDFKLPSKQIEEKGNMKHKMLYEIEDIPSWYLTIFLGFQHYLLMAGATLSLPLLLMPKMCMPTNDPDMGNIISTYLFVSGIVTILQTTFGTRLPIVQGGSFAFLIPALAILDTERWKCPAVIDPDDPEIWQSRMRELQGAIISASFFQIILGFFGVFGFIMSAITPITLASSVIIIGLSLYEAATLSAATDWPVALITIILIIVFSQYLRDIKIPIPFTKSKKRPGALTYPMFQIFPVLLTIIIVWALCALGTAIDIFSVGNAARVDVKFDVVHKAQWFRVPYPFQWGMPTFTTGATIGFLSAVFAGIVESLGEYQACARIVRAPKPTIHTINRGIFIEGIGCLLTGMFGTGNGTTSYSENTGAMSITKVGSRRVVQTAGFLMMIFSMIGKLGAFFVAVPEPIIGGILCVTFAMIIAVGLSNLQNVDLTSSRNMFILGFTIFFSLATSKWVDKNKSAINFGHPDINFTFQVLFSTGMFIAAITSMFLDNTIPGTLEERGLLPKPTDGKADMGDIVEGDESENVTYDLPFGMKIIRNYSFTSWIPISPTYKQSNYSGIFKRKSRTS